VHIIYSYLSLGNCQQLLTLGAMIVSCTVKQVSSIAAWGC